MEPSPINPELETKMSEPQLEVLRELEKLFGPGRVEDYEGIPVYVTESAAISLA
jgi:hypothetical protein